MFKISCFSNNEPVISNQCVIAMKLFNALHKNIHIVHIITDLISVTEEIYIHINASINKLIVTNNMDILLRSPGRIFPQQRRSHRLPCSGILRCHKDRTNSVKKKRNISLNWVIFIWCHEYKQCFFFTIEQLFNEEKGWASTSEIPFFFKICFPWNL